MRTKSQARIIVERFLNHACPEYPDYSMELQENGVWAFWVAEQDTTSYLHEDGNIEWYGTGWPDVYEYHEESGSWGEVKT